MAYIDADAVKVIRKDIKAKYPAKDGWKFSITKRDSSVLTVAIMQAPIPFVKDGEYQDINHHYISKDDEKTSSILEDITRIANKTNYDKSEAQVDYFDVGFYFYLKIGKWDKPFQCSNIVESNLNKLGL